MSNKVAWNKRDILTWVKVNVTLTLLQNKVHKVFYYLKPHASENHSKRLILQKITL